MTGRAAACLIAAAAAVAAGGCGGERSEAAGEVTLRFWGLGREGEVVREMVPEFERANPGVRVEVQQIPWIAADAKLLTAVVGDSTPDVAQLGNTWIAEMVALRALLPLSERVAASPEVDPQDYFAGIWDANVVDGGVWGVPWYVDTRVLFYRRDLLATAGFAEPPRTWSAWREVMDRVREFTGPQRWAVLLPVNEFEQPVIFGLEQGSTLLADGDRRGAFSEPAFVRAMEFYVELFRDGLAPVVSFNQVGNVYQDFARGDYAFYITGPWNLGEFARRLPPEMQDAWATAPMPAADGVGTPDRRVASTGGSTRPLAPAQAVRADPARSGARASASPAQTAQRPPAPGDSTRRAGGTTPGVSLAGGASLVVFRSTRHPDLAWRLIEFLSSREQQLRLHDLCGDLPARIAAWDDPSLADPRVRAFRAQLDATVPMPKVPEWQRIVIKLAERLDPAVRGRQSVGAALAALDADVDRILEKRRWLLDRPGESGGPP